MKWNDVYQIAEYLNDNYPDEDPLQIRFTKLRELILNIPEFNDNPNHCNEKILEAIQQIWIDEKN